MKVLVIMTGTSGAGKTVQLGLLESRYGNGRVLTITTRAKRDGEGDDAYHFVSDDDLTQMASRKETVWVVGQYGNRYSISEEAILRSLRQNRNLAFVAITLDCHEPLTEWCVQRDIIPVNIHLTAPEPDELHRRLLQRDGPMFNPERIRAHTAFEEDARRAAAAIRRLHFIEQANPGDMHIRICSLIDRTRA